MRVQTYPRWRREYGGMPTREAKRLADQFVRRGVPDLFRSDNGSEFTAENIRRRLQKMGVKAL